MRIENYAIIAPALSNEAFNEAEAIGSAVWLWMHSDTHRNVPLHLLTSLLLPAIQSGQFALANENNKPVFYLSWAKMSLEAEWRHLRNLPHCLPAEDWTSGERIWFIDWIAPFAHSQKMREIVKHHLFANLCARSLYHRAEDKNQHIINFHGIGVAPEQAQHWFSSNPPALHQRPHNAAEQRQQALETA